MYIYKMYLVSAQGYINAGVRFLKIEKTDEIWPSMKDIGIGLGVRNISDLVIREIRCIYEKKELKEEIKNYKMTEKEVYKKFDNLSEDELNTKNNKNTFVRNNVMTNIIKHCRKEKQSNKSNRPIQKKINDSRF